MTEAISKVDSAIEAGDAKGKVSHRRASSSAANVFNINDLGMSKPTNDVGRPVRRAYLISPAARAQ
jgi:hypothetical protein